MKTPKQRGRHRELKDFKDFKDFYPGRENENSHAEGEALRYGSFQRFLKISKISTLVERMKTPKQRGRHRDLKGFKDFKDFNPGTENKHSQAEGNALRFGGFQRFHRFRPW